MTVTLFLYTDDTELRDYYRSIAEKHNQKVNSIRFADSGFDLYSPEDTNVQGKTYMFNYKVKCAMYKEDVPQGYYLYARSSIYKTRLRMANSVGIIDSGYRGNICAVFDVLDNETFIEKHQRLNQICHPTLEPFFVRVVETEDELGSTDRGEGGFGSTGK